LKTSEAIQALRPFTNLAKATEKLGEVLTHIEETEKVIGEKETRLDSLTNKIQDADVRYSRLQSDYATSLAQLQETHAARKAELDRDYEKRQQELEVELGRVRASRDNVNRSIAILKDEEATLTVSIRDKKEELRLLGERIKNAVTGASQLVAKV